MKYFVVILLASLVVSFNIQIFNYKKINCVIEKFENN
jgi:hypothetical protein